MKTEVIVDRRVAQGEFVRVTKVMPGFPEPSFYRIETERGLVADDLDAEKALKELAKYL